MRLEIKPIPTQKQRKEIKGLSNVISIEVDRGHAWVVHVACFNKESYLASRLAVMGFMVKGYDTSWGLEDVIKGYAKFYKKKNCKKRTKRRVV